MAMIAVPSTGRYEYLIARLCFIFAFLLFGAKLMAWGMTERGALHLTIVAILGGALSVGLSLCLNWVGDKQKQSQGVVTVIGSTVSTQTVLSDNEALRHKTKNFTDSLRRFEENARQGDAQALQNDWARSVSGQYNKEESHARFIENTKNSFLRSQARSAEFSKNYRPDALSLHEELIASLRKVGILEPFPDQVHDFDNARLMLDMDALAGARPIGNLADYLDFLARKLPK